MSPSSSLIWTAEWKGPFFFFFLGTHIAAWVTWVFPISCPMEGGLRRHIMADLGGEGGEEGW